MALPKLLTPLVQIVNGVKRQVMPETEAAQVKLSDGTTVQVKIDTLVRAIGAQTITHVVANIAARDAITDMKVGDQAWVKDATGDSSVKRGAAKYLYEGDVAEDGAISNGQWVKTAEVESMDMVFKWADIQDKPTSAVEDIDKAVGATKLLDGHELTVADDKLQLDGKDVAPAAYKPYVTISPEDEGFDAAVEALNLPDGAIFTVVKEEVPGPEQGAGA